MMYVLVQLGGEDQQCQNGRQFSGGQGWIEERPEGLESDKVCKDIDTVKHQAFS